MSEIKRNDKEQKEIKIPAFLYKEDLPPLKTESLVEDFGVVEEDIEDEELVKLINKVLLNYIIDKALLVLGGIAGLGLGVLFTHSILHIYIWENMVMTIVMSSIGLFSLVVGLCTVIGFERKGILASLKPLLAMVTVFCIFTLGSAVLHYDYRKAEVTAEKEYVTADAADFEMMEMMEILSCLQTDVWRKISMQEKVNVCQIIAKDQMLLMEMQENITICATANLKDEVDGQYDAVDSKILLNKEFLESSERAYDVIYAVCRECYVAGQLYNHAEEDIPLDNQKSESWAQEQTYTYLLWLDAYLSMETEGEHNE